MASTTAAPSANGASGITKPTSASSGSSTASSRAAPKSVSSSKVLDNSRKQAGSPVDSAPRKSSSQKAWMSGTNPLTQRPVNSARQNGAVSQPKSPSETKPSSSSTPPDADALDKKAHDRLLFLLANFVGCSSTIRVSTGQQYVGIFSGASIDSSEVQYVLKMTKQLSSSEGVVGSTENATGYVGQGEDSVMAFDIKDVVELNVRNVSTDKAMAKTANGALSSFKTDVDISGNLNVRERNLEQWEPTPEDLPDLTLQNSGSIEWDQFETNERLYGVKSDYDENLYTTSIDRSHPEYKNRAAAADKLARQIMESATTDVHVAEERGLASAEDGDADEESKYSGVKREFPPLSSNQPHRYTPPARRAPTGQATVSGAPVDPAIIASQLARPDAAAKASRAKEIQQLAQSVTQKMQTGTSAAKSGSIVETISTAGNISEVPNKDLDANKESKSMTEGSKTGAADPAVPNLPPQNSAVNATANVENELLSSYKSWANAEKMKLQYQRHQAIRRDKEVKLNDLKKFATNFKLHSPVPPDLVPILAKDPHKQEEIMERAKRQAEVSPVRDFARPAELGVQRSAAGSQSEMRNESSSGLTPRGGRQSAGQYNTVGPRLDRPSQVPYLPSTGSIPRNGPGQLGQRLTANQQQHRDRNMTIVPQPIPIQEGRGIPAGPAAINTDVNTHRSSITTPTSAVSSKFNAMAIEFKPNPAASTFTPTSSQSTTATKPDSTVKRANRAARPSFLDEKKPRPASERPSIADAFNPITRMKKEVEAEKTQKNYVANGGIPQAYRTPPTWDVAGENLEKSYADMFEKYMTPAPSRSSSHASQANGPMPHQHQLPLHLQQGSHPMSQGPTPHGTPRHPHPQPHHPQSGSQHFDDHRMHVSSSQSSSYPSPRMQQQPVMGYPPMFAQMQPQFGPQVPQFSMGPGGQGMQHMRQMPAGAQMLAPGAHMATPMMMTPSNGTSMMGMPIHGQMPVYSPGQGHVFPTQMAPVQPSPGPGGYGSPRPGAPMMMHQGSQQGQMPQPFGFVNPGQQGGYMFTQQHPGQVTPMRNSMPQQQSYGSSPHLQHHMPVQHGRASFSSYSNQMPASQPMHHSSSGSINTMNDGSEVK